MSVIGLDIGNENCVVAVAKQRGIEIVLNDESKRETPAVVCFGEKQRFLGTAAVASATMNPKSTVSQIKRLVGRQFSDPEVQNDLSLFPFKVLEAPDGGILVDVKYLSENKTFTPTQILGMILSDLKVIAMKNLETTAVSDCVIGIPAYFTELQRRAYLDAATIAKLKPLRLMHESTAMALSYGIYKTDLPENESINVIFVDIGHSDTQVSIASFSKGKLKMLSHAFDRSLGGRDFDEILFNHFAKKFKEDYRIDVFTNLRASTRLRAACEKLKKVLSANAEAPLNIECLMDEKDVRGFIKRDEFEKMSSKLLEKLKVPCQRALEEAHLSLDKIYAVEVVGSGSRIPVIARILSGFFKKETSRTLNASECIARGCALQCAMLSPTFRVREFQVQDSFPFSVALCWKGPASEADEGSVATQPNSVLFPKGNPIPSTKMLTFYRSGTFTLEAVYADTKDLPLGTSSKISTFTVGPFQTFKPEKPKIKVKIRLNLHGIVTIESASLIEEEEVLVTESATPMEAGKNKDVEPSADATADDTGNGHASCTGSTSPAAVNSAQHEVLRKKKSKRSDIPVTEFINGGLPQDELQKAVEKEHDLADQDKIMEETKDRKNALESYVYDMRNKLFGIYSNYATESERGELSRKLQETEEWLYEEGDDEIERVYIAELEKLKSIGDPIEHRYREEGARAQAANELMSHIMYYGNPEQSGDKFDHIDPKEKREVIVECQKAKEWLTGKMQQQDAIPKNAKPILHSDDIREKTKLLDRDCKSIMSRPKPKSTPKSGDTKDPKQNAPCGGEQSSEPMDIDNVQDPEN